MNRSEKRAAWKKNPPAREAALEKMGQGIVYDSDRGKLLLTGPIKRGPLRERIVKAKNVTCRVKENHLVGSGEDKRIPLTRFNEVQFYQGTGEIVLADRVR